MSDGYLLDTNVISVLANPRNSRRPEFEQQVRTMQHVWLPVIAIAEIEFGMAKAEKVDETQRGEVRAFFQKYPQHLDFNDNTIEPYALLRAQLWKTYATKGNRGRGHKESVPEELFDRVTGQQLGVDERDLMIASIAAENGLILATNDSAAGMKRIEEVAQQLHANNQPMNLRIRYLRMPTATK